MLMKPFYFPVLVTLLSVSPAWSHGTSIEHRTAKAIEIRATYDDGKPMGEAQVTVYAPNDPTTPWLQGQTTEEGTFAFVPDPEMEGNWDVKVRQSGHGDLISIPLETASPQSTVESPSPEATQAVSEWQGGGYTPLQKFIMAALGVWGFVGTALFFARKVE